MVRRIFFSAAFALVGFCAIIAQQEPPLVNQEQNTLNEVYLQELAGVATACFEAPVSTQTSMYETALFLVVTTDQHQGIEVLLGPSWATSIWTEGIVGQAVHLEVFKLEDSPYAPLVAKELHWDGHTAKFRDENLRPFWLDGYNQGVW